LTPCFFTLLPGLLLRKRVRVPDLSLRRQARAQDLLFRRQGLVWDQLFRKLSLLLFRQTWYFPPFIDSMDILQSRQEESTGQI
jgi:hypothetical protein